METRGLEHHVFAPAGLDRLVQLVGVFEGTEDRRHGRGDVLAMLQDLEAVPRMAGGIGRNEYRLDAVVFDHVLQRRISLAATADSGQLRATVRKKIAHRHHLHIRVVLEAELRPELADAIAGDANPNFAIGNGPPAFRGQRVLGRPLKSLDRFLLGKGRLSQSEGRGPQSNSLHERAPGDRGARALTT